MNKERHMEITSKVFGEEVLKSKKPVLLEFWGSWCPPCKMMEPVLAMLESEFGDRIKVCKINADLNPILRSRYDIRGLPTFIIFKKGKEIERHIAAKSKDDMKRIIERHL